MASQRAQFSFYISEHDYDLQLLYVSGQFKQALKAGIAKYLQKKPHMSFSIPERIAFVPKRRITKIYFYPGRGERQEINFLQKVPKGNLSTVITLLIRNVLEYADLDMFMRDDIIHETNSKKDSHPNEERFGQDKSSVVHQEIPEEKADFIEYGDDEDFFYGI